MTLTYIQILEMIPYETTELVETRQYGFRRLHRARLTPKICRWYQKHISALVPLGCQIFQGYFIWWEQLPTNFEISPEMKIELRKKLENYLGI